MVMAALTLCLCASAWGAETAGQQTPVAPVAPKAPPAPRVHVVRGQTPYLGVNIEEITPDRASALKLKNVQGVEITLVDQDAAAGKAGLSPHDVVVSVDGTPVEGEEQFRRLIRETPVGRPMQLGIVREGQPMTLQATMGSRPGMSHVFSFSGTMPRMAMIPEPPEPPDPPDLPEFFDAPSFAGFSRGYTPRVGIVAEGLTPQLAQYFGAKEGQGLLVRSVEKGSVAEQAGLKAGDVITKLNGEPVSGSNALRRAFRGKSGNVSMSILRDKREQTLVLKLPERRHSGQLNDGDFGIDVDLDMSGLNAALRDMEPQIEQAQLVARNEALKAVNSDAFRKQMEEVRKEIERSSKELQKKLQELQ
ncbi:MAG: PDZ domain-containing protein [Acidobacteriaceae bacterium]